jgi:hypothetical protein
MYQLGYHWNDFRETGCWDLCETVTKAQMWLKSDKNVRHITWKIKHVFIVQSITKYSVDRQQCKGNTSPHCHCNTRRFSIVDSDKCLNTAKRKHFCFFELIPSVSVCLTYLVILQEGAVDEIAAINGSNWKRVVVMLVTVRGSDLSVRLEHV